MKTKIYVLSNPDGGIRYIGKTIQSLRERFCGHLLEARKNGCNHRCNWIRSLLQNGKTPKIEIVGEVEGDGCKEEIAWIKYFRAEGIDLTNDTIGGEGGMLGRKLTLEHRAKISKANTGRKHSDEAKKRMSIAQRSPEQRKKLSIASLGKKRSKEVCRKISIANTGKRHSAETRLKISLGHMGQKPWNLGKHQTEEIKQKLSIINKGKKLTPEQCRKISITLSGRSLSDDHRHKIGIANKGKIRSEKTLQKLREASRKRWDRN